MARVEVAGGDLGAWNLKRPGEMVLGGVMNTTDSEDAQAQLRAVGHREQRCGRRVLASSPQPDERLEIARTIVFGVVTSILVSHRER